MNDWIQYAFAFVVSGLIWLALNMFWVKRRDDKTDEKLTKQTNTIDDSKVGVIGYTIVLGLVIGYLILSKGKKR